MQTAVSRPCPDPSPPTRSNGRFPACPSLTTTNPVKRPFPGLAQTHHHQPGHTAVSRPAPASPPQNIFVHTPRICTVIFAQKWRRETAVSIAPGNPQKTAKVVLIECGTHCSCENVVCTTPPLSHGRSPTIITNPAKIAPDGRFPASSPNHAHKTNRA